MRNSRWKWIALMGIGLLGHAVQAQLPAASADLVWPTRPVTLLAPHAAGGGLDNIARVFAQRLGDELKQAVVVENRPGAGGNIGQAFVARAARDGYTLLVTGSGSFDANPALYRNPGFDPVQDFEPIAQIATGAYLLVAGKQFPPDSVKDLVEYARARPGQVFFGSAGNGTPNHLVGEMLKQRAGVDMVHVPYKGAAAAATDMVAGRVQWSLQSYASIIPFVQSGDAKVLATIDHTRERSLSHVPTLAETYPGLAVSIWYGVFAPAGTPKPILDKLRVASGRVVADPAFRQRLEAMGLEARPIGAEQFRQVVVQGVQTWSAVVRGANIQVD